MTDERQLSHGRWIVVLGASWLLASVTPTLTRYATGWSIGDTTWPEALLHGALVGAGATGAIWLARAPPGAAVATGGAAMLLAPAGLFALSAAVLPAVNSWQLRRVDRLLAELDARPLTVDPA